MFQLILDRPMILMSWRNSLGPYLPLELEKLIFEVAVSEHGTKASTPLLLVAKRVRECEASLSDSLTVKGPLLIPG